MGAPEYDDIIERIMSASAPKEEEAPDGEAAPDFRPEAGPEGETVSPEEPERAAPEETTPPQGRRRPPLPVTGVLGAAVLVLGLALAWQVRANGELTGRYSRVLNIWAAENMYHAGDYEASARLVSSLTGLQYNGADYLIAQDVYAADPEARLKRLTETLQDMGMDLEERQSSGGRDVPHGRDADVEWIAERK